MEDCLLRGPAVKLRGLCRITVCGTGGIRVPRWLLRTDLVFLDDDFRAGRDIHHPFRVRDGEPDTAVRSGLLA